MQHRFVIDTSVAMSWCFEDEAGGLGSAILRSLSHTQAVAPGIFPLEAGNVLVVAERRGRITGAESRRFLELLRSLPIIVEADTPERVLTEVVDLARESGLSTYDASYLHLAMRLGLPIATFDGALNKAASTYKLHLFTGDFSK